MISSLYILYAVVTNGGDVMRPCIPTNEAYDVAIIRLNPDNRRAITTGYALILV